MGLLDSLCKIFGKVTVGYLNKAVCVIIIFGGLIRVGKGIRDSNVKLIAKGIFGTAATLGGGLGGALGGAYLGTIIFPVVGTIVGGIIGGYVGSEVSKYIVEDLIIESF